MKYKNIIILTLVLTMSFAWSLSDARAQEVYQVNTRVELISEETAVKPGRPFWVGLRMKTDPHWHTYWRNPGDSGAATTIQWDLPEGFSASKIHWPYPKQFEQEGISSYGYAREMVLLVKITPLKDIARDQVTLNAQVDWLACEVPCLPGQAQLSLTLPVSDQMRSEFTLWKPLFDQSREELPQHRPDWKIQAEQDEETIVVNFYASNGREIVRAEFFPYESRVLLHAAPQKLKKLQNGLVMLALTKDLRGGPNMADRLEGVAVLNRESSNELIVLDVDIPIDEMSSVAKVQTTATVSWFDKFVMIVFAFMGGIVLNLMPCFFPVLSIKVMHYVGQSRDRRHVLVNALGYAAGIVATFLLLAMVLIVLRAGGSQLGWGFQFQSPYFVTAMVLVLFMIALNFFGVFEINSPTGVSVNTASGQGLGTAFASGILAVIVATPCAAPFMGAAVSFALTQTILMNLAIFLFLGLGLAFPFVLLCLIPKLVEALPKPGPWMEHFKKSLGFVMLALVLWLLWVLSGQKEANALVMVLFSMLVLSLGLWIWGAFFQAGKRIWWKKTLAVLFIAAGIASPFIMLDRFGPQGKQVEERSSIWIPYDAQQLAQWEREGEIVFLDFYARWCLTCQVNQKVALDQSSVRQHFKQLGIITVKADWTNKDPEITAALERFGRATLPTYVLLYGPPGDRKERILPKMLTPGIVKQALDEAYQHNKEERK